MPVCNVSNRFYVCVVHKHVHVALEAKSKCSAFNKSHNQ